MLSFHFLICWTLIHIIHRQFSPVSHSLCVSHLNLTSQTHKGHVALQGAHGSSRYDKCVSKELTRYQARYYKQKQYGLSFCITSPCAASLFYMSVPK